MGDPREGRTASGLICTGVGRSRIEAPFAEVVGVAAVEITDSSPNSSVFVYGSVATGEAVPGRSDVDLLAIGLGTGAAARLGRELSARFGDRCRAVEIGAADRRSFGGDDASEDDEAYGNRVFLRHYCVHIAGARDLVPDHDFPADARAARGFNGDIGRHRDAWRRELAAGADPGALARRIARKALLAVAGLVSVHDETWTTDRAAAARRWSEIEPSIAGDLTTLLAWADRAPSADKLAVASTLDRVIDPLVERFENDIGLWA